VICPVKSRSNTAIERFTTPVTLINSSKMYIDSPPPPFSWALCYGCPFSCAQRVPCMQKINPGILCSDVCMWVTARMRVQPFQAGCYVLRQTGKCHKHTYVNFGFYTRLGSHATNLAIQLFRDKSRVYEGRESFGRIPCLCLLSPLLLRLHTPLPSRARNDVQPASAQQILSKCKR
jgi:hypothetical protein